VSVGATRLSAHRLGLDEIAKLRLLLCSVLLKGRGDGLEISLDKRAERSHLFLSLEELLGTGELEKRKEFLLHISLWVEVLTRGFLAKVQKEADWKAILVGKVGVLTSLLLTALLSVLARAGTIEVLTETLLVFHQGLCTVDDVLLRLKLLSREEGTVNSHIRDVLVRGSHMGMVHLAIPLLAKLEVEADWHTVLLQEVCVSAIGTITVGVGTGL